MTTRTKILRFLEDYMAREGWAPTHREIMEGAGVHSTSTVHDHLHRLEAEGVIEIGHGARAIRFTRRPA